MGGGNGFRLNKGLNDFSIHGWGNNSIIDVWGNDLILNGLVYGHNTGIS